MLDTERSTFADKNKANCSQKAPLSTMGESLAKLPEITEWIDLVTKLQSTELPFAIYRLPQQSQPHLLVSTTALQFKSWAELSGRSGFVIAPFDLQSGKPLLLLPPEFYFKGIEEGIAGLSKLLANCFPTKNSTKLRPTSLPNWAQLDLAQQKLNYQESFAKIQAGLNQGCRKLVLSRASAVPCPEHNNIAACFIQACDLYPNMMVTLSFTPESGTWLGSTPETLLQGKSARAFADNTNEWHTMSLAGTMANEPDLVPVARWSSKNQHEQNIVTEFLSQQLQPWSQTISLTGPHCVRAGHLLHLRTEVDFTLNNKHQLPHVLESIHPTPAVCGMPKQAAFTVIRQAETYERGYYAGVIGLYGVDLNCISDTTPCENAELNAYQHTQLFVNLRCMQFFGAQQAICYAGGGILPESDVESEFAETQNKMQTMRRLFENL